MISTFKNYFEQQLILGVYVSKWNFQSNKIISIPKAISLCGSKKNALNWATIFIIKIAILACEARLFYSEMWAMV